MSRFTPDSTNIGPETIEKWRKDTKLAWSDEEKVTAWRKWGRGNIASQQEATGALLAAADIGPNLRVIDIAGGAGDPALAVAAAVGAGGRVTVTDVSEGMLETVRQFAEEDGLSNLDYQQADAERLPFADASFDRALCRCGVMFFADHDRALQEVRRVLKPGGKTAFLAWGPMERVPLFSSIFGPIRKALIPPAPPPGTPWPFKFAEHGSLVAALEKAGFQDVSEEELTAQYRSQGSANDMLQQVLDMGGLHGILAELPAGQRDSLLSEALENYRAYSDGKSVTMPLAYVLASGMRGGDRSR